MKESLRLAIELANKRATGGVRKTFARKANDAQMLDVLARAARRLLDAPGGWNSDEYKDALRELRTNTVLAERRK